MLSDINLNSESFAGLKYIIDESVNKAIASNNNLNQFVNVSSKDYFNTLLILTFSTIIFFLILVIVFQVVLSYNANTNTRDISDTRKAYYITPKLPRQRSSSKYSNVGRRINILSPRNYKEYIWIKRN